MQKNCEKHIGKNLVYSRCTHMYSRCLRTVSFCLKFVSGLSQVRNDLREGNLSLLKIKIS